MQYKTGVVSVEQNSNIVTGSGTLWLANVEAGDWFKVDDRYPIYQIASVDSNIQITLTVNYAEVSGGGLAYCIVTDFTAIFSLPLIFKGDIDWPDIYNKFANKIDENLGGHKTRHQDGGADEISIAGLSGAPSECVLLAGRSGGQTIYGGIGADENLYLRSTSHATKGKVFLGLNSYYDEANDLIRLGDGAISASRLQIGKGTIESPSIIDNSVIRVDQYYSGVADYINPSGYFTITKIEGASGGSMALGGVAWAKGGIGDFVGIYGSALNITSPNANIWGGWFVSENRQNTGSHFGIEIGIRSKYATPHRVVAAHPMGSGLWIWAEEVAGGDANPDVTWGIGIGSGGVSRYHTGIIIPSNVIVPESDGVNEAMRIRGGSIVDKEYGGIRITDYITKGLDLSAGTFSDSAIDATGKKVKFGIINVDTKIVANNYIPYFAKDIGGAERNLAFMDTENPSNWILCRTAPANISIGYESVASNPIYIWVGGAQKNVQIDGNGFLKGV